jgi:hypothetical protein
MGGVRSRNEGRTGVTLKIRSFLLVIAIALVTLSVFNFISGTGPETLDGAILIALADAALVMWIACRRRLNFFLLIPLRGAGWS